MLMLMLMMSHHDLLGLFVCCSTGAQTRGYVPSSVYKTRTQYRTQRYPTFSVLGQPSQRFPGDAIPSMYVNPACWNEAGSHHEDCCTYQANTSHPSAAIGNTVDEDIHGLQLHDEVAITPCMLSDYSEISSTDSRSQFVDDQSRYISTRHSHMATSRLVTESHDRYGINHTLSCNFYSTSSHYSTASRLTMPAAAAVDFQHMPSRPSTVTSHSVSTVQQIQNVIQISKPFQSADVLRFSEKLRRQQRLTNTVVAPSEFL